jgi:hypothetical protein
MKNITLSAEESLIEQARVFGPKTFSTVARWVR